MFIADFLIQHLKKKEGKYFTQVMLVSLRYVFEKLIPQALQAFNSFSS